MRHLLFIFFLAAGTQAQGRPEYFVELVNKCMSPLTVYKRNDGPERRYFLQSKKSVDTEVNTQAIVFYDEPGTIAMFTRRNGITEISIGAKGSTRSAVIKALGCPDCPQLWCDIRGCKTTGDTTFSNFVTTYIPRQYYFEITYCGPPIP